MHVHLEMCICRCVWVLEWVERFEIASERERSRERARARAKEERETRNAAKAE